MKIAIIPQQNKVNINGSFLIFPIAISGLDLNGVHALHWDTETKEGEIEYVASDKPNKPIKKLPQANAIIEAFNDEKAKILQREADAIANLPYDIKRRSEYPETGEQLEAIWEMLGGMPETPKATLVKQKIAQVKEKYPKT
jgi:hypothetical protein